MSSGKVLVGRDEGLDVNKALEACCLLKREDLSFSGKFVEVSSFLGLLVVGFEKEINSLLRKMESRKGHGVEVSKGSRKFSLTRLVREI